jgi:sugar/nucleoside kinase (ribokinase family)
MYSVYALGNPLLDFIAPVEEEILDSISSCKGTMNLVDREGMEQVLSKIGSYRNSPGGSAANTVRGITWLNAGQAVDTPLYCGAVGSDARGQAYRRILEEAGISIRLAEKALPTGCSVILVTPDHERTMFTHLGACRQYRLEDLDTASLEDSRIFYTTGYMWDTENQKEAVVAAMGKSKKSGLKVCFDLADPFVVQRYHAEFRSWLPSRIDVLFGNRDEFRIMFGTTLSDRQLVEAAARICPTVLMKVGCDGCYVHDCGDIQAVEGFCVEPLDTTAAGDCFSAAFIYGLTQGYSSLRSAKLANRLAASIVTVLGCDFTDLDRNRILREGLS